MRDACWGVLDAAWSLGIRYFDAARSYGAAEEFLSGWLMARGIPGPDVLVGSKWGYYYTANWQIDTQGAPHEVKEHSAARLRVQVEESAALLARHLDLYQIHSATLDSGVLDNAEVLGLLAALKQQRGWRIGLSLSGVGQALTLRRAMEVQCADGSPLFDSVQATWNLLEQSAGEALLAAHNKGMSVIVKEALANGRLTPRYLGANPALSRLQQAAQQAGSSMDALALAVAMRQPFRPLVLSGAVTPQQLHSNAGALRLVEVLPGMVVEDMLESLRQPAAEYWAERSSLAWN